MCAGSDEEEEEEFDEYDDDELFRSFRFLEKVRFEEGEVTLNQVLRNICNFRDVSSWKPNQSIFKLVVNLPARFLRYSLEAARLLVPRTNNIEDEIFYYATQGKVIEFASLLMVAHEKVLSPSFFERLSQFPVESHGYSSQPRSFSLRNFLVAKLASVTALLAKHASDGKSHDVTMLFEQKQALMCTLLLLEIFEKVGKDINTYLLLNRDVNRMEYADKITDVLALTPKTRTREVAWLLQNAGFSLNYEDIDLTHHLERTLGDTFHGKGPFKPLEFEPPKLNLTQPDLKLLLCGMAPGQKGVKEFTNISAKFHTQTGGSLREQQENAFTFGLTYEEWKMDSAQHLREPAEFFLKRFNTLQNSRNFYDDRELRPALESLCSHQCLNDWTPKMSLFKLLYTLCLPELSEPLTNIRLAACNTENIAVIGFYYAKEGKLVWLAALLMVAREKLMPQITCENKDGSNPGEFVIEQFIMHEIENQINKEVTLRGRSDTLDLANCKYNKAIMLSALELLEVYERAGNAIDQYMQSRCKYIIMKHEVAKDVAQLLCEMGFSLNRSEALLDYMKCLSDDPGPDESENLCKQKDAGLTLHSNPYPPFPLRPFRTNIHHSSSTLPRQHALPSTCSVRREFHMFSRTQTKFGQQSSLPLASEANPTTKKLESWISSSLFSKKLASIALAISRGAKHV